MSIFSKFEKKIYFILRDIISPISPAMCTRFMVRYYKRQGMRILGQPNYISAKIWFDGTDYSQIELNEGCTISSNIRILTHDWSLYTIGRGMGLKLEKPIGIFRSVRVGKYAFVGTGSILMPGANVGDGAIVGAGSVVRGSVPDWAIIAGSPAQIVGDSREFMCKNLKRMGLAELLSQAEKFFNETKGSSVPNA